MPEESTVIQVLREHRLALESAEDKVMLDMGNRWLKIEQGLNKDMLVLSEEMVRRQASGEVVSLQMTRLSEKYKAIEQQLKEEATKYNRWAESYIAEAQEKYAALGIQSAQDAINATFYEQGMLRAFDRVNVDAIESMIGFAGDGSPLYNLLKADYGDTTSGIIDALVNGLGRGQNPYKTAEDMRDAMGMGLDRALLIARTETARAYRTASTEQYRASGVVDGFMRLAKKDTACLGCLFLDGEIYETASELEDHPNGKCMVVPIVQGVNPPEWEHGQNWFEGLDEDRQRDLLGEQRFELWKSGKIPLENFVGKLHNTTWGDSPKLLSMNDLLSKSKFMSTPAMQFASTESGYSHSATRNMAKIRSKPLSEYEKEIANNRGFEMGGVIDSDGKVIYSKAGERYSVAWTDSDISKMRGKSLTHNHPTTVTFSADDIAFMQYAELKEIRVVSEQTIYSAIKTGNATLIGQRNITQAYEKICTRLMESQHVQTLTKQIRIDAWNELADSLGLQFKQMVR